MNLRSAETPSKRRTLIAQELGVGLDTVAATLVDEPDKIHCENLIGAISLPLGVAGPISILRDTIVSSHFIPLATTEGALVASVSRGAKVISQVGGATVDVKECGPTRGPVFETAGILESRKLEQWIETHFEDIADVAARTSRHLNLLRFSSQSNGKYLYVRFIFNTDEAMGMNMVTIASDAVVKHIESETATACVAVAGNYDVDKKPSWLNFIEGRGKVCTAEVVLPAEVVASKLHVTAEEIIKTVRVKCSGGSIMSGSMGYNAHFANTVAAFFAATGQDLAHVAEGSIGITSAELLQNGDLYISVYAPDIMLGTVGGGTQLKTQSEARALTGTKNSKELAEVLIAAVLAGELSLLASITEKTLGNVHNKLGR